MARLERILSLALPIFGESNSKSTQPALPQLGNMQDETITIGASPAQVNLTLHRGAAFDFTFQLLDANDAPVNCTGCTLLGKIVSVEDGAEIADLSPTFTTAASGIGAIARTASNVDAITAGRYLWNLRLVDATTKVIGPLMEGNVTVKGKRG